MVVLPWLGALIYLIARGKGMQERAVADMAARGANFGVHVVVTVTQGMQVRMRMMSAMGGRIELRMNDAYDSEFERKMMEQVSKDAPGRGLTGDHDRATRLLR